MRTVTLSLATRQKEMMTALLLTVAAAPGAVAVAVAVVAAGCPYPTATVLSSLSRQSRRSSMVGARMWMWMRQDRV